MNNSKYVFVYNDISINSDNYKNYLFEIEKFHSGIINLEDHFPNIKDTKLYKMDYISDYEISKINFKNCIFYGNSRIHGLPVFITNTIYQIRKEKLKKLLL